MNAENILDEIVIYVWALVGLGYIIEWSYKLYKFIFVSEGSS